MATYTGQVLINKSLTDLGILEQGGTPSVSDSNAMLTLLNFLIQQWHLKDLFVWSVEKASYALVASQGAYPIGPAAASPFNVPRPTFIEQALIGVAGPNPSNQITYPLKQITQKQYGDLADTKAAAHIPQLLYNDRASPASTLYLWPVPRVAIATSLILYTWAQLGTFTSLSTAVELPDGYPEAITAALAYRALPMFGVAVNQLVAQAIGAIGTKAEAMIAELNSSTRNLTNPMPEAPQEAE